MPDYSGGYQSSGFDLAGGYGLADVQAMMLQLLMQGRGQELQRGAQMGTTPQVLDPNRNYADEINNAYREYEAKFGPQRLESGHSKPDLWVSIAKSVTNLPDEVLQQVYKEAAALPYGGMGASGTWQQRFNQMLQRAASTAVPSLQQKMWTESQTGYIGGKPTMSREEMEAQRRFREGEITGYYPESAPSGLQGQPVGGAAAQAMGGGGQQPAGRQKTLAREQYETGAGQQMMNLLASLRGPENYFQYANALSNAEGSPQLEFARRLASGEQIPAFQQWGQMRPATLGGLVGRPGEVPIGQPGPWTPPGGINPGPLPPGPTPMPIMGNSPGTGGGGPWTPPGGIAPGPLPPGPTPMPILGGQPGPGGIQRTPASRTLLGAWTPPGGVNPGLLPPGPTPMPIMPAPGQPPLQRTPGTATLPGQAVMMGGQGFEIGGSSLMGTAGAPRGGNAQTYDQMLRTLMQGQGPQMTPAQQAVAQQQRAGFLSGQPQTEMMRLTPQQSQAMGQPYGQPSTPMQTFGGQGQLRQAMTRTIPPAGGPTGAPSGIVPWPGGPGYTPMPIMGTGRQTGGAQAGPGQPPPFVPGHQVNVSQWGRVMPSQKKLQMSALEAQGVVPEDWLASMRRAAPQGQAGAVRRWR